MAALARERSESQSLYPTPSSTFSPPPEELEHDDAAAIRDLLEAKLPSASRTGQPSAGAAGSSNEGVSNKGVAAMPEARETHSSTPPSSSTAGNLPNGNMPDDSAIEQEQQEQERMKNPLFKSEGAVPSSSSMQRRTSAGQDAPPSPGGSSKGSIRGRRSRPNSVSLSAGPSNSGSSSVPPRPASDYTPFLNDSVASRSSSRGPHRTRLSLSASRRNSNYSTASTSEPPSNAHSPLIQTVTLPSGSESEELTRGGTVKRRSRKLSSESGAGVQWASASPRRASKALATSKSNQTLKPDEPWEAAIQIRDYAFPATDPRYIGLPQEPPSIDLSVAQDDSTGYRDGSWYDSPSLNGARPIFLSTGAQDGQHQLNHLSSSSSSSLSSAFTPPPFGSFGFGNQYHYSARPGGAEWGQSSEHSSQGGPNQPNHAQPGTSGQYSWNFVPDHSNHAFRPNQSAGSSGSRGEHGMAPDALLGSALRIDDFDEYDDDGSAIDEEEESGRTGSVQDSIQTGGQLYRAAYPFQPEAPQEMGLAEGDLVRVWEQLCDGWVVGGKVVYRDADGREEEVETGLIPQNYLVSVEEQPPSSNTSQATHETERRHSVHEEKIIGDNNLRGEGESIEDDVLEES